MGPKEKYNIIINTIEELAQGRVNDGIVIKGLRARDISEEAFSKANCSTMDNNCKNVLFTFLLGKNVIRYIEERKMMAAYKSLVESNQWDRNTIWNAIEIAGVGDEKAFAKKFKKFFNTSPKKAFLNKDMSLITKVKDWDTISAEGKSSFVEFGGDNMMETKFGISKEKFMVAYTAGNLQAFYNLNEVESELAFDLYEKKNYPLEDTFEYIYNYVWSYIDEGLEERDKRLYEDLMNPKVLYMYFNCGMTFNEIIIVLHALEENELPRKLEEADKNYLLGFRIYCKYYKYYEFEKAMGCKINEYTYEEIYEYYNQNANEKERTDVYIKFIEYAFSEELCKALCKAEDDVYCNHGNEYRSYEEEEEIGWLEEDYENRILELEECDYEPDFDDIDVVQNLWMDHDYIENVNTFINEKESKNLENFDIKEFEKFCDFLDSKGDMALEQSRKLIGYKNLDVKNIVS